MNRPYLSGISNPESRQPGKAPTFSVNWCYGDDKLEVVNTTTGKLKDEQAKPSRVCKQALFRQFLDVYGKIPAVTEPTPSNKAKVYGEMKSAVKDYQSAKQILYKMFADTGLGNWVKKPVEQDLFCLSH